MDDKSALSDDSFDVLVLSESWHEKQESKDTDSFLEYVLIFLLKAIPGRLQFFCKLKVYHCGILPSFTPSQLKDLDHNLREIFLKIRMTSPHIDKTVTMFS